MLSGKASWRKQIKAEVARMRNDHQANRVVGGKGSPGKGFVNAPPPPLGREGGWGRREGQTLVLPLLPLDKSRWRTLCSKESQLALLISCFQERSQCLAHTSVPQLDSFLPSCPGRNGGGHIPLLQRTGFRGERPYREAPSPPPPCRVLILQ